MIQIILVGNCLFIYDSDNLYNNLSHRKWGLDPTPWFVIFAIWVHNGLFIFWLPVTPVTDWQWFTMYSNSLIGAMWWEGMLRHQQPPIVWWRRDSGNIVCFPFIFCHALLTISSACSFTFLSQLQTVAISTLLFRFMQGDNPDVLALFILCCFLKLGVRWTPVVIMFLNIFATSWLHLLVSKCDPLGH